MKDFFKKTLFSKKNSIPKGIGAVGAPANQPKADVSLDRKIQEGIKFTVTHYADTFKDLARYDRGERFISR